VVFVPLACVLPLFSIFVAVAASQPPSATGEGWSWSVLSPRLSSFFAATFIPYGGAANFCPSLSPLLFFFSESRKKRRDGRPPLRSACSRSGDPSASGAGLVPVLIVPPLNLKVKELPPSNPLPPPNPFGLKLCQQEAQHLFSPLAFFASRTHGRTLQIPPLPPPGRRTISQSSTVFPLPVELQASPKTNGDAAAFLPLPELDYLPFCSPLFFCPLSPGSPGLPSGFFSRID